MAMTAQDTKPKQGYKQTEIGVIPEDWKVKELGELTTLITNGFVGKVTDFYTDSDDGIIYIQGFNVEENSYNLTGIKRVTPEFHKRHPKSHLREGDLLTIQTGEIGLTTIVTRELEGSNCHALVITRFRDEYDSKYCSYYFNSFIGRARFKEIETGSTMKHLNVGDLRTWLVPLPPTKAEQHAIAKTLSDVDALIASQDRLIAKKRDIKQGAMQQLLTGKTRLPGFSGEWEKRTLREIGKPYGGLSGKSKEDFVDGRYPYIPFLNIMKNPVIDVNYFDYVNIGSGETQNRATRGDLFFNGSSETPEEVGMCSVLTEDIPDLYLNSFCFGFRLHSELNTNGLYLSYFFRSSIGRQLLYSLAQGATRYNLSKSQFLLLEIPYPSADEQHAIATILADMDTEIAALERRREKTVALKQGMMEDLLTGKTRLL